MIQLLFEYSGIFDAAEITSMSKAFNYAWATVEASGAPYACGEKAGWARGAIAKHIIEAAKLGERDPHKLSEAALLAFATIRSETSKPGI